MHVHHYQHATRLDAPGAFNLQSTVLSHGWVMLEPWRWDGRSLVRQERFGEIRGILTLSQPAAGAVLAEWGGEDSLPEGSLAERVARWLSWGWDASRFEAVARSLDPQLAAFVTGGGGRFLRGSCFYEDFVKTVCTINTTWAQTLRMVSALAEIGGGTFPTPGDLLNAGSAVLKERCRLGFRTETVLRATERMLREGTLAEGGEADEEALTYKYLLSLWGIGPYAAAHCRMLLHDFSRLPVDSEVSSYLAGLGIRPENFGTHYAPWGEYAFLGYKLRRTVEKSNWIGDDLVPAGAMT